MKNKKNRKYNISNKLEERGSKLRIKRIVALALFVALVFTGTLKFFTMFSPFHSNEASSYSPSDSLNIWWPVDGVKLSGTQPFKAIVQGLSVEEYEMFWRVDGGSLVVLGNDYSEYPHKRGDVDFSGWTWNGEGPYTVSFIAKGQNGETVAERSIKIYNRDFTSSGSVTVLHDLSYKGTASDETARVEASSVETISARSVRGAIERSPSRTTNEPSPADSSNNAVENETGNGNDIVVANPPSNSSNQNPFQGEKLFVDPNSNFSTQANLWRNSRPEDAKLMDIGARGSQATWLGDWTRDIRTYTDQTVTRSANAGSLPVLVAYNMTNRDCGSYSQGGASSSNEYLEWVRNIARGVGNRKAVVVLEPDALSARDCLSASDQNERTRLIREAVSILRSAGNIAVYIDIGHSRWLTASEAASRLREAGIDQANGFALNVSNYYTNQETISYGEQISLLTGNKHFVIDTSRNGNGPRGTEWCNPSGRALGGLPTLQTNNALVDAMLWIKAPGESDGTCNGGPNAGEWWPEYALELVRNANL
jgi:endoglucanase